MRTMIGSTLLLASALVAWGVLSLDERSVGTAQTARLPFVSPVEQRNGIIRELREIKTLLKEQNVLLRAAGQEARE
ncbi:MAG: hypothetical protein ACC628_20175 [Pirellulaceae bacterium]